MLVSYSLLVVKSIFSVASATTPFGRMIGQMVIALEDDEKGLREACLRVQFFHSLLFPLQVIV